MVIKIFFWLSVFGIFWAMVGYPMFLKLIRKLITRKNITNPTFEPTVAIMIVAHNEEEVILEKLTNAINLDYPKNKMQFLIASDNSTDKTNEIVEKFIGDHPNYNILIHKTIEHKGKTNAQNETQKLVNSEILVMTDANAMMKNNAVKELVASFADADIAYVCGRLIYRNTDDFVTSRNEGLYWKLDLMMREIESDIQTITAGNGAIYACRNTEYYDFPPIESHDLSMPLYYALRGKRALFNKDAIAYEKAGENDKDEFRRKVRMNRGILRGILPSIQIFNIFKYKWFSVFYLGHRSCRYALWLFHLIVFVGSGILSLTEQSPFYITLFILQILFGGIAYCNYGRNWLRGKLVSIICYYCMTICAQIFGVIRIVTGKTSPVWEKAESTR